MAKGFRFLRRSSKEEPQKGDEIFNRSALTQLNTLIVNIYTLKQQLVSELTNDPVASAMIHKDLDRAVNYAWYAQRRLHALEGQK